MRNNCSNIETFETILLFISSTLMFMDLLAFGPILRFFKVNDLDFCRIPYFLWFIFDTSKVSYHLFLDCFTNTDCVKIDSVSHEQLTIAILCDTCKTKKHLTINRSSFKYGIMVKI